MTVGLGLVGTGWWGKVLTDAAAESGEARVVSCFARTKDNRDAFAAANGCTSADSYEAILSDPAVEGIVIATTHSSHLGLIETAAAAGKPILVEKPLTLTLADARRAVEVTAAAGVPLQVGHQRRRSAANRAIKQMIDAGDLGEIQAVETNQSLPNAQTHPDQAWRRIRDESPLGGMTSLGVHKIDTMHYLAGPMKRVFTFTKNTMAKPEMDEATVVAVEFESGALGTLITSFVVPVISRVSVYGFNGTAHNEADGTKLLTQTVDGGPVRTEVELTPVDPIADQMAEFAQVVRGEAQPETGGKEGLAVVAVMEAMIKSADEARPVDVVY
ncbi:MAG: Gfo/Idh/MocA family oxidoreductase [Acidimicrobiia bacterium]|nr:Gfo/Idh/MocA family oxidoreductase [Acidimicrobiia bacterium]